MVFFVDGAQIGVHAAAGLQWDVHHRFGLSLDFGVQHHPSMPQTYDKTALILGLGAQVRAF